ncbi:MAG: transposase [Mariniphaga sp.]
MITRFGNQEGAEKGYNPKRHGRKSHHPIIAFVAETKMIANAWMRTGDSASATEFKEFLDNTFTMIPREQIGLLRGDSGFSGNNVLNDLEQRELVYIIAMPMKAGLVDAILTPRKWVASETQGVDLCSFMYQSKGWGKSRRIVVVRKDVEKLPNCGGKTLFSHEDDYLRYRYSAYVTTSDLSDELVWVTYKHRAEAENQIKELKYDYAMEGFCFKDIHATEFAFRWVMMAYNLMSYVRNKIAVSKVKHTLSTLKFRCIAIGAYLVSSGRQKKLMLAVSGSKRDYIEGLFEKIRRFEPQKELSTA